MNEQPAAQTTTATVCGLSSDRSGAMACHVPARDVGLSSNLAYQPRSAISNWPSDDSEIFSSLISL